VDSDEMGRVEGEGEMKERVEELQIERLKVYCEDD
jgi:hypothetical protein